MADQIRVEVVGLRDLERSLAQFAPELRKSLRLELRALAETAATDARSRASWSKRIPNSISTKADSRGVSIVVSRAVAPHGPLYERGSTGSPGTVRHPLFGNHDHWYANPTRPFVKPAIEAAAKDVERRAQKVIDQVARRMGF